MLWQCMFSECSRMNCNLHCNTNTTYIEITIFINIVTTYGNRRKERKEWTSRSTTQETDPYKSPETPHLNLPLQSSTISSEEDEDEPELEDRAVAASSYHGIVPESVLNSVSVA